MNQWRDPAALDSLESGRPDDKRSACWPERVARLTVVTHQCDRRDELVRFRSPGFKRLQPNDSCGR
jgi:hypothetical protein